MAFIMDGFKGDSYDHEYPTKEILKRIHMLFEKKKKKMLAAMTCLVMNTAISTCVPLLLSDILDQFDRNSTKQKVVIFAVLFIVLNVMSWVLGYIQKRCTKETLLEVNRDIQNASFDASVTKDMSFFDENSSAKIISRITGDTESLSNVVDLMITFLKDVLVFTVLIVVAFVKNPKMTLVLLAFIPVITGVSYGFRKIAKVVSSQLFQAMAQVNQAVKECIIGITVTKNFSKEEKMYQDFLKVNEEVYKTNIKQGLVFSGILPIMNMLSVLGTALIVLVGANQVLDGKISYGELYLFIQAVGLIWNPITSLANFWGQFQEGMAAAERVFSLMDAKSKVNQTDEKQLPDMKGAIQLQNVTFRYNRNENVLEDFSLQIKPGEKIALVGHTGSGKSTIVQLILRFYEFNEGKVTIDGQDIRSLDMKAYREQIGYVGQTPFLFSGTVLENILYGNVNASKEDAIKAANKIGNGQWLEYLPDGIETQVGERGNGISLGQRQLVAIARLILKKPSILIFDEATANIDPITEHYIQEALKYIMQGRTSIMIAHRLTTIRNVDRIIALANGKIIEEGKHEELLKEDGYYKELYNKYFKFQDVDKKLEGMEA